MNLTRPLHLPNRYYVPLVLANGVDFCQIDFSGSMTFKDHIKGYYSCWYKKGRPHAPDPVGLIKLMYQYVGSQGPVEIGEFEQTFDPRVAVLQTRVSMEGLELSITTFLTGDHTLIERFRVERLDEPPGELRFSLDCPFISYTDKPLFSMTAVGVLTLVVQGPDGGRLDYRHQDEEGEYKGAGLSTVKVTHGQARLTTEMIKGGRWTDRLVVTASGLGVQDEFVRLTTVIDSRDTPEWEAELASVHRRHTARAWDETQVQHIASRRAETDRSSFRCDSTNLTEQFDVSLYVCQAATHPNGSSVTTMNIPNGHSQGTYWDVWYAYSALIRANRVETAARINRFWRFAYPEAKRVAAEHYHLPGARFEWVLRCDGKPRGHADQVHNNVIPVFTVWEHYQYTREKGWLTEYYDLMVDSVVFLIAYALRRDDSGQWFLRELVSPDESQKRKKNDLHTAVVMLKGVKIILETAQLLGQAPPPEVLAAREPLRQVLGRLTRDGVMLPYEAGGPGTWAGALAHIYLPNPHSFAGVIEHTLDGCREPGGYGIGRTSRMRCANFPWVDGIFAWAMARNGDRRAGEFLKRMLECVSYHGGIPEYVWFHGEPSRDWYVAAHGVFVTALAELCVQRHGDRLDIFPLGREALPWTSCEWQHFRVAGGLLVDLGTDGKVGLHNDTDFAQELTVIAAGQRQVAIRLAGRESRDL